MCPSLSVGVMKRASIFVVIAILLAACEGSPSSQPDQSQAPGQSQDQGASQAPSAGSGGGGGDGAALVEAANAVTDWCTLMPSDLASDLVPDASDPQSAEFPSRCTVSNGVSVLEITYQSFVVAEMGPGAETISGIAESAWLEPDYPVDDAYLTVILSSDPSAGGTLYVEVAGHDSIDHGDDAIAVAQAVIAELN